MATYEVKVDVKLNQAALSKALSTAFKQITKFVSDVDKKLGNIGSSIKPSNISNKISEGLESSLDDIQAFVQVANEEFDKLGKGVDLSNVSPSDSGARTAPTGGGGGGGGALASAALIASGAAAGSAAKSIKDIPKALKEATFAAAKFGKTAQASGEKAAKALTDSSKGAKSFKNEIVKVNTASNNIGKKLKRISNNDFFKQMGESAKKAGIDTKGMLKVTEKIDVTTLLKWKKALNGAKNSIGWKCSLKNGFQA